MEILDEELGRLLQALRERRKELRAQLKDVDVQVGLLAEILGLYKKDHNLDRLRARYQIATLLPRERA